MHRTIRWLALTFTASLAIPITGYAQHPTAATYITDDEVKTVLATPGIDHTIRVVDIGSENFSVGIIHRGATGAPARSGATAPARATAPRIACGDQAATPPADAIPGAISHDSQTEGYYIVSGGGTLVTGGRIVNGARSAPDAAVTTELNGPSCSGMIAGPDLVKRIVKVGDIIIIPAGVPHGWTGITDHVDYLSFRPSDHVLTAGYVHPSIRK
jgi:mannose-6-phosphate isomerase-like protein (cupin superfamily)